jgi:N-hydroxyarylamine O-acetyltransferase
MLTKHLPGRHVTVTHESLTIRTPDGPTEHRPLGEGEIEEWLSTLDAHLLPDEQIRLLDRLRTLTAP